MKIDTCLYCYAPVAPGMDLHEKCSLNFFGSKTPPQLPYTLQDMAGLAKKVIDRSIAVPGVQAKLSMSLVQRARGQTGGRLTVVGALGGNYIFKPPSDDFEEMPANEHITMRIAQAFGIKVVPSCLLRLQSGELSYITKRIDRTATGNKIHMLDMFQITEAFDKYRGSMERVGRALASYSENTLLDQVFLLELTVFSYITGNNDMHLKNFSMIKGSNGWGLAPAYDLVNVAIANPGDTEELALSIEGKKKKLKRQHFERFGAGLGLTPKQVKGVFDRILKNRLTAEDWVKKSFLSAQKQTEYIDLLDKRYAVLFD